MSIKNFRIAIIGLGYVGLPLAVAFADKYKVIGFDINSKRIEELNEGNDVTLEVEQNVLSRVLDYDNSNHLGLFLTSSNDYLKDCNIYIVTVPTPIDKHNRPDLTPMIKASETIAAILKVGDIVIYESTVYPGVTEDEMVPVLERISGLKYNIDFYCGYSPERINPGDKERTVTKILKITSGSNPEIATIVDELYKSVITAGTHKAPNIKVAEAAKVIENSQRDINIAFVNELSKIFSLIGIDTNDVLDAAGTKWNFLKFKPGLVGGHCIGVDPYYLAQKAQEVGYHPEIILSGRRVNDGMGEFIAKEVLRLMISKEIFLKEAQILIMGFTFKENCPDIRNTKVIDIYNNLRLYGLNVVIFDPLADSSEVKRHYGISLKNDFQNEKYDCIILAVSHDQLINFNFTPLLKEKNVIFDIKGVLPKNKVDGRL